MIDKPKKERRFLKALGRVGEILIQEVLIKIGSNLIKKIGGKKTLPSILFLLASLSLFAQFPNTGNKQRLGFQTTGDGLVWRGSISDTASIQPINNQSAWLIIDTVNLKIYSFDFTSNVWNPLPYVQKSYVDSIAQNFQDSIDEINNGYFKQEFQSVIKDTLNWTKPVQLPIGGSNLLLVYRNGQMINDAQYSVIDTNKLKINSGSYKLGENYTIVYVKGGGGSGGGGVAFDTSTLNLVNRFAVKLNISDTAAMLLPYATKAYADTTGRFYARQDYTTGVTSSTLTWTQTDTLIPGGVTFIQVYRNGQILLPSQYTIPTSTSVIIAASSFKVNDNYTVIFPRGGGAGSGGGSGSLTSISAGTGITVSPNPITTTGTVSADLSVLMELTDTSLLNLTTRFASKLNTTDTASMLTPYFRDADTTSLNLISRFALKLNALDTASLSNRIDAKGTGTVTSVATGYGLSGGTITSTGTLVLDSAVVFSRIRDSIVDVAIGNDTIKILKQEYAPATTSVLTWTVTSKFPIQSKSFILVFRNGQLLINDQYNLTDTNKITIVSNSFKVGANYTVVTVSGIGSVGTGVFPNPVYPEAGIALSTGSAWASSIPNNSANWNIAFNDKITNAAFSGTNTKTLTLTQYDGGTFAPTFTDLQGVTGVTAGTGLTGGTITTTGTVAVNFGVVAPLENPTFTGTVSGIDKTMVGLGNVDNTTDLNKPISTATQTALNLKFNTADTSLLNLTSRFAAKLNLSDTLNMLVPYLRKADTTLMLSKYLRRADTSLLNLTSRFAAKLNISDTASMLTNYLRTNTAASTYLPLTGGTLSNNLNNTLTVNSVATNTSPNISLTASASSPGYHEINIGVRGVGQTIYSSGIGLQGEATQTDMNGLGSAFGIQGIVNGTGAGGNGSTYGGYFSNTTTVAGNNYGLYVSTASGGDYGIYQTGTGNNYFAGATTLGSTLAVTGAITEGGNNVLTNLDTASLSSRINSKFNSSGGTISGAVTINDELNLSSGYLKRLYLADGSTSVTVTDDDTWIRLNNPSTITITLPSAASYTNREIHILNVGNGSCLSASTNVVNLTGTLGFVIFGTGGGKWATLVSNGSHWQIMQAN